MTKTLESDTKETVRLQRNALDVVRYPEAGAQAPADEEEQEEEEEEEEEEDEEEEGAGHGKADTAREKRHQDNGGETRRTQPARGASSVPLTARAAADASSGEGPSQAAAAAAKAKAKAKAKADADAEAAEKAKAKSASRVSQRERRRVKVKDMPDEKKSRVDLNKLDTNSLRRYRRKFELKDVSASSPKVDLVDAAEQHFRNFPKLDEKKVLRQFIAALSSGQHRTS